MYIVVWVSFLSCELIITSHVIFLVLTNEKRRERKKEKGRMKERKEGKGRNKNNVSSRN